MASSVALFPGFSSGREGCRGVACGHNLANGISMATIIESKEMATGSIQVERPCALRLSRYRVWRAENE